MKFFSDNNKQITHEIALEKDYKFMYENFLISSQSKLYLLLEENEGIIDALCFDFKVFKYGYPNDEVGHSSCSSLYAFCTIKNSTWINEVVKNNRSHHSHSDTLYSNIEHYVIRFKDVTLEVLANKYELIKMSKEEFRLIIDKQLSYLEI